MVPLKFPGATDGARMFLETLIAPLIFSEARTGATNGATNFLGSHKVLLSRTEKPPNRRPFLSENDEKLPLK